MTADLIRSSVLKLPFPYQLGSLNGTDGQPTKITPTCFALKLESGIFEDPTALPMIVDSRHIHVDKLMF